ncbi:MAG TPA: hypothetical protein DDZ84_10425 [Firmicutes bacterium]|nr:hypothetical protein [Bacillota bacterium]
MAFTELFNRLLAMKEAMPLVDFVEMMLKETGLLAQYENTNDEELITKHDNLMEFLGAVQEFQNQSEEKTLEAFLENVALVTDLDMQGETQQYVTLMTMHSAKGLEFPVVFIAGMEENVFPLARSAYDPAALEEERRLCYVGITRAKDRLYLVHAFTRAIFGSSTANPVSRFVEEIPGHLLVDAFAERYAARHGWRDETRVTVPGQVKMEAPARVKTVGTEPSKQGASEFAAGDKVRHAKFGEGTVVSVNQRAGEWFASIAFPGGGIKQFLLSLAPIEKVH